MTEKYKKRISKFLSLILRHQPDKIDLKLNENGWADVNELIEKCGQRDLKFTIEQLEEVVATNDKKRFAFNEDKTKIRASQGHSIKNLDLELEAIQPPEFLYHGTVSKFIRSIQQSGLQKMSRQHVHLSQERETAMKVGNRRGIAIILSIQTGKMHEDGFEFYRSENGVWLTENVPTKYIEFKEKK